MSVQVHTRKPRSLEQRSLSHSRKSSIICHGNFHIDTSSVINEGRNAKIVKGINITNRTPIAVKAYLNTRSSLKEGATELAVLNIMRKSDVVPHCYGAFEDSGKLYILMEQGKCDLWSVISKLPRPLGEEQSRPLFRSLVQAVNKLHARGIYHGDIKLENVLFNQQSGKVTLIDFGTSLVNGINYENDFCPHKQKQAIKQLIQEESQSDSDSGYYNDQQNYDTQKSKPRICGKTLGYIAPEILLLAPEYCDHASADVYSLGVILYTLIFQRLPVADMVSHYYDSSHITSLNPRRKDVTVSSTATSSLLRDLIYSMLHTNPEMRISMKQVLEHPWMNMAKEL